jgi:hypothetical protein
MRQSKPTPSRCSHGRLFLPLRRLQEGVGVLGLSTSPTPKEAISGCQTMRTEWIFESSQHLEGVDNTLLTALQKETETQIG